ncbi:lipoprotein 17-related variable surface protein [Mycoplasmopsis iners]|uniref:lipoprotein 17-related variable surface protein n=1 Tax=Mycoplasmopsis iners TaxID=76630 RepID=UPI000495FBEF|nr:lipoprotein 17-related variable surface protein [Mycoplasmopsis iners]
MQKQAKKKKTKLIISLGLGLTLATTVGTAAGIVASKILKDKKTEPVKDEKQVEVERLNQLLGNLAFDENNIEIDEKGKKLASSIHKSDLNLASLFEELKDKETNLEIVELLANDQKGQLTIFVKLNSSKANFSNIKSSDVKELIINGFRTSQEETDIEMAKLDFSIYLNSLKTELVIIDLLINDEIYVYDTNKEQNNQLISQIRHFATQKSQQNLDELALIEIRELNKEIVSKTTQLQNLRTNLDGIRKHLLYIVTHLKFTNEEQISTLSEKVRNLPVNVTREQRAELFNQALTLEKQFVLQSWKDNCYTWLTPTEIADFEAKLVQYEFNLQNIDDIDSELAILNALVYETAKNNKNNKEILIEKVKELACLSNYQKDKFKEFILRDSVAIANNHYKEAESLNETIVNLHSTIEEQMRLLSQKPDLTYSDEIYNEPKTSPDYLLADEELRRAYDEHLELIKNGIKTWIIAESNSSKLIQKFNALNGNEFIDGTMNSINSNISVFTDVQKAKLRSKFTQLTTRNEIRNIANEITKLGNVIKQIQKEKEKFAELKTLIIFVYETEENKNSIEQLFNNASNGNAEIESLLNDLTLENAKQIFANLKNKLNELQEAPKTLNGERLLLKKDLTRFTYLPSNKFDELNIEIDKLDRESASSHERQIVEKAQNFAKANAISQITKEKYPNLSNSEINHFVNEIRTRSYWPETENDNFDKYISDIFVEIQSLNERKEQEKNEIDNLANLNILQKTEFKNQLSESEYSMHETIVRDAKTLDSNIQNLKATLLNQLKTLSNNNELVFDENIYETAKKATLYVNSNEQKRNAYDAVLAEIKATLDPNVKSNYQTISDLTNKLINKYSDLDGEDNNGFDEWINNNAKLLNLIWDNKEFLDTKLGLDLTNSELQKLATINEQDSNTKLTFMTNVDELLLNISTAINDKLSEIINENINLLNQYRNQKYFMDELIAKNDYFREFYGSANDYYERVSSFIQHFEELLNIKQLANEIVQKTNEININESNKYNQLLTFDAPLVDGSFVIGSVNSYSINYNLIDKHTNDRYKLLHFKKYFDDDLIAIEYSYERRGGYTKLDKSQINYLENSLTLPYAFSDNTDRPLKIRIVKNQSLLFVLTNETQIEEGTPIANIFVRTGENPDLTPLASSIVANSLDDYWLFPKGYKISFKEQFYPEGTTATNKALFNQRINQNKGQNWNVKISDQTPFSYQATLWVMFLKMFEKTNLPINKFDYDINNSIFTKPFDSNDSFTYQINLTAKTNSSTSEFSNIGGTFFENILDSSSSKNYNFNAGDKIKFVFDLDNTKTWSNNFSGTDYPSVISNNSGDFLQTAKVMNWQAKFPVLASYYGKLTFQMYVNDKLIWNYSTHDNNQSHILPIFILDKRQLNDGNFVTVYTVGGKVAIN